MHATQCRVVRRGRVLSTRARCCGGYGLAGAVTSVDGGSGRAYLPFAVLMRNPQRVHSPSWVSMLRGCASENPLRDSNVVTGRHRSVGIQRTYKFARRSSRTHKDFAFVRSVSVTARHRNRIAQRSD